VRKEHIEKSNTYEKYIGIRGYFFFLEIEIFLAKPFIT
jgi:hypothetical protein